MKQPGGERELTLKAVAAGVFLSLLFGAANAYLGMKAGLTVAATIPAAVIGLALFRLPFFRGGVLEQNVMRTAASVGEALAAGAVFTIPAFLLVEIGGQRLWTDLGSHFWESAVILTAGGLLGALFIIVLRRPLCIDSDLPFPESTASAAIVRAGQHGGDAPQYIFGAMGLGALLQLLKSDKGLLVFRESLSGFFSFAGGRGGVAWATPAISPALVGIGYIIGPRLAAINAAGGLLASWTLIPLILFLDPAMAARFGSGDAAGPAAAHFAWQTIVRPIAVGAMLVAAAKTLHSMREPLLRSLRGAWAASARAGAAGPSDPTDTDIPLRWILPGAAVLALGITAIYWRLAGSLAAAIFAGVIMTVTGFVLSAVGGYLVGLVGGSNQPVSGLTLSALVISALVMITIGARGLAGVAAVLGVASVVCCAVCVSGSLIQDLKAGHLLRGTPWKMEVVEIITVVITAIFLMFPIIALHQANLATGGIGGKDLPAPQAGLMAQLAAGIVGGQMPWGLFVMGLAFGVVLLLITAPSPMLIAVGMYLPFETVTAIFAGGVLKWIADRVTRPDQKDDAEQRGLLVASGLIAGEAIVGILLAVLFLAGVESITKSLTGAGELALYARYGGWLSLLAVAVIAYSLIQIPRRQARR